jgi:ankyrin repeat protein
MQSNLNVDAAWKHLYRSASPYVVHATILNSRFYYMKEYLDRGFDLNQKDFQSWSPLHYASYIGNTMYLKNLLSRIYINVQDKNEEGKTAV